LAQNIQQVGALSREIANRVTEKPWCSQKKRLKSLFGWRTRGEPRKEEAFWGGSSEGKPGRWWSPREHMPPTLVNNQGSEIRGTAFQMGWSRWSTGIRLTSSLIRKCKSGEEKGNFLSIIWEEQSSVGRSSRVFEAEISFRGS
jgi:hypothetical protein